MSPPRHADERYNGIPEVVLANPLVQEAIGAVSAIKLGSEKKDSNNQALENNSDQLMVIANEPMMMVAGHDYPPGFGPDLQLGNAMVAVPTAIPTANMVGSGDAPAATLVAPVPKGVSANGATPVEEATMLKPVAAVATPTLTVAVGVEGGAATAGQTAELKTRPQGTGTADVVESVKGSDG